MRKKTNGVIASKLSDYSLYKILLCLAGKSYNISKDEHQVSSRQKINLSSSKTMTEHDVDDFFLTFCVFED